MAADGELGERLPALGSRGQGWVAGQMLLVFLGGVVSYPAFDDLPPSSLAGWLSFAAGLVMVVAGAWMVYRGMDALGPSLTAMPAPAEDSELVLTGAYERVRHPIYAGVILLAIGWAFLVVSLPALVVGVLLAGWHDLKSRREEVWLVERYPAYRVYRQRTARFLPGVY